MDKIKGGRKLNKFLAKQKLLKKASCDCCGGSNLDLRILCQMGDECIYWVKCLDCSNGFEFDQDWKVQASSTHAETFECPVCISEQTSYGISPRADSKSFQENIHCDGCGYVQKLTA